MQEDNQYAVIAIFWAHTPTSPQILCINDKVVIFDTPGLAKEFLGRLGGGRRMICGADGETASYIPLNPKGYNRAIVITGYDPYDVPKGLTNIHSEAKGMDWKSHVHWSNELPTLRAFADKYSAEVINNE